MTASRHRWVAIVEGVASRHVGKCVECGLRRNRKPGTYGTVYRTLRPDGTLTIVTNQGRVPTCPPETKEGAP